MLLEGPWMLHGRRSKSSKPVNSVSLLLPTLYSCITGIFRLMKEKHFTSVGADLGCVSTLDLQGEGNSESCLGRKTVPPSVGACLGKLRKASYQIIPSSLIKDTPYLGACLGKRRSSNEYRKLHRRWISISTFLGASFLKSRLRQQPTFFIWEQH